MPQQIIEKTKSIEVKLKYQIDKLLKMAISITSGKRLWFRPAVRCPVQWSLIKVFLKDELDPLSFKPNLSDFSKPAKGEKREADEDEDEEEEDDDIIRDKDEDEDVVKSKSGVYVPPKLAPVHYGELSEHVSSPVQSSSDQISKLSYHFSDLDETPQDRAKKQMERLQRRAINSSIMRDLETEYSGAPEEIRERYANTLAMETAEQKHKRE